MKQLLIFFLAFYIPEVSGQVSFDSAGLAGFKQQIKNASILALGEMGHGYESINEAKSSLTRMLQRELEFEAISFESSFTESVVSYLNQDSLDLRLNNFLYPFWNTASVKTALQSFYESESNKGKPLILGFDVQEDCRFQNFSSYLLKKRMVLKTRDQLKASDSVLSFYIGKNFSRKTAITDHEYEMLNRWQEAIREEVGVKYMDSLERKLLLRSFDNRKWLIKYLTIHSVREKMYFRDSLMAENIKWIKNELFPHGKLLVWAADTHIARQKNNWKSEWMGEWLSDFHQKNYFSISFQKGNGGNQWLWENTSFIYPSDSGNTFDMVVFMKKIWKIRKEEWVTRCN